MTDITLGSFTLSRPLASGGMGEVWLGFHTTGDPVAIKVILESGKDELGVVETLQAEIRAVANGRSGGWLRERKGPIHDPERA